MSGALAKCERRTSTATVNVTFSVGSADGPLRYNSRAGEVDLFGQPLVPASRSQQRGSGKDRPTKDTSGLCSFGSSASADLQRCLANRLLQTTDTDGSPEYEMTWRKRAMQSGAPICRLAARARRTSGSGCSGWPTPDTGSEGGRVSKKPAATVRESGTKKQLNLQDTARLAGWPTPMAGSPATEEYNEAGNNDSSRKTVALLVGWNTPTASDWENGRPNQTGGALSSDAALSGWATPQRHDAQGGKTREQIETMRQQMKAGVVNLNEQVMLAAIGAQAESSLAATAKPDGYRLNPAFSLWLQGYPDAWACCAEQAIASCRKSRRSSSGRFSKRKGS